jgi:NAD(P)-dependent dehydrogenase (short-subunit alcohol dehydrogenase family)
MAKIALVTGTSSGIGLSTAVLLAKSGYTVVATLRNLEKAGALRERARSEGVELDVRRMDVEDASSVHECVAAVLQRYGRVDVLVNNAGVGFLGSLEHTSEQDLRRIFEVNFFGVWRVTQAVVPHMREARSGRILTVTSIGGLIGQPFNDAYCAAKFAVEGFMESLSPVLKPFGVYVSLVEPGPVNTEFVANVGPSLQARQTDEADPYRPMLQSYLSAGRESYAVAGQSGDDVARILLEAAAAQAPHLRYLTSDSVKGLAGLKYADLTGDRVLEVTGSRFKA